MFVIYETMKTWQLGDQMFKLIKICLQESYRTFKKHLASAFIYIYLTSLLFMPMITHVFNQISKAIGIGEILNAEVYRTSLSTLSVLGIVLISFVAIMILLIEFGVMIIIAQQNYFRKSIGVSKAFATTLKKLPILLGFASVQLLVIFFLLILFTDSPVSSKLLDVNLLIYFNNFIQDEFNFIMFLCIVLSLLVLFLIFIVRWLFTFHYIFIEQKTVFYAMAESWRLTKGNQLKVIVKVVLFNLVMFQIGLLMLTGLSYLPYFFDSFVLNKIIEKYVISFSLLTLIFLLLYIPVNITIITRLFYRFKNNHHQLVTDDLLIVEVNTCKLFDYSVMIFFKKKIFMLVAMMVYVASIYIINDKIVDNLVYLTGSVQVASHRGDIHSAPENSLSSIQAAMSQFVDAVEIDVMLTKDDVIVLNHDATFERVAGVPKDVEKMTSKEVAYVDIGRLFSEELSGEMVPTLNEALELIKEGDVVVIIDLKLSDLSRSKKMAEGIVQLIEKHQMEEMVYVQSFKIEPLQEVRKLNSNLKIGQILYLSTGDYKSKDVDFFAIRQTLLTEEFVEIAHSMDREVWVWTVNLPWDIRKVLTYDIDGIITDYPERVQRMK